MAQFRKLPVVVEASQWQGMGDHPAVHVHALSGENPVRLCEHCKLPLQVHGFIFTLEGGHIVCPGDWIITGVHGEHYPCKPDIFEKTYEAV